MGLLQGEGALGPPDRRAHDWIWIDLRHCTTAAETLDTIIHASRNAAEGGETDDAYIAGLVRGALDEVLDPMADLCSSGRL